MINSSRPGGLGANLIQRANLPRRFFGLSKFAPVFAPEFTVNFRVDQIKFAPGLQFNFGSLPLVVTDTVG